MTDPSLPRAPLVSEPVLGVAVTDVLLSRLRNDFLHRRSLRSHRGTFGPPEVHSPLRFPLLDWCKFWRRHFTDIRFPLGLEIVAAIFVEIVVECFSCFLHLEHAEGQERTLTVVSTYLYT